MARSMIAAAALMARSMTACLRARVKIWCRAGGEDNPAPLRREKE
jgi:hypothetical protein